MYRCWASTNLAELMAWQETWAHPLVWGCRPKPWCRSHDCPRVLTAQHRAISDRGIVQGCPISVVLLNLLVSVFMRLSKREAPAAEPRATSAVRPVNPLPSAPFFPLQAASHAIEIVTPNPQALAPLLESLKPDTLKINT